MGTLRRIATCLLAVGLLAGGVWFIAAFEDHLHCTQATSFRIAAFDMEPHTEEAIEGGPPLVYRHPFALPLRIYLSAALLAFVFGPGITAVAIVARRATYRVWRLVVVTAGTLLLMNALVPNLVVGERFSALAWYALFGSAIPLIALFLLVRGPGRTESTASTV